MSYTPQFRTAVRTDVPLILQMIRDLADYENLLDEVIADEATLEDWLFDRQRAEVIFALFEEKRGWFCALFPQLLHLPRAQWPLFGGPLCYAGISSPRHWHCTLS